MTTNPLAQNFNAPSRGNLRVSSPSKNFSSIGGYNEEIEQISYVVDYLKSPELYTQAGIAAPKGLIISGPSGIGKSLFAEAIAGQAGVSLLSVNAGELQTSFGGPPEAKILSIFEHAKTLSPCVLSLDGIENIAKRSNDNSGPLYSLLLTLLENDHPGVVVIATTEDVEQLNQAIVRPGRFDRHIILNYPRQPERVEILNVLLQGKQISQDVSLEDLSATAIGMSGAELASLVNDACHAAIKEGLGVLNSRHLESALMLQTEGVVRASTQDIEDLRLTAAHESGHAIVGHLVGRKVYKISVLPTQSSWGRTIYIPREGHSSSKDELVDFICIGLAGRAAEILMNTPAVGCADDLRKVKNIAKDMIHKEAMGKTILGQESEVEEILQTQLDRAIKLLEDNRFAWEGLRDTLVDNGHVLRPEFLDIMQKQDANKNICSKLKDLYNLLKSTYGAK